MKIRVFDNSGKTYDRYTVIIGKDVYTMNGTPFEAYGFNLYSHTIEGKVSDFVKDMGDVEVNINDLPEQVREAIIERTEGERNGNE